MTQFLVGIVQFVAHFIASTYQEAILQWVLCGRGHGTTNARAGSGKTRTLQYIAEAIKGSCCYLVFNSANSREAREKFPSHIEVKTIHSAGFGAVRFCLSSSVKVNDSKYLQLADRLIDECFNGQHYALSREEKVLLEEVNAAVEINRVLKFVRVDLVDPNDADALLNLAFHYELDYEPRLWDFYCAAVPLLLKRGKDLAAYEVDFTDMLYLPATMGNVRPKKYDWLLVDECQDLSKAQLEIVKKMLKPGGRALFVGDPNQAIYGFAGADCNSYQRIVDEMNAAEMPLSICYRCDKAIVREAQRIVPTIEAAEWAEEGNVRHIKDAKLMEELKEGDMVLCRTNAPLVSLCFALVAEGIPARIKGRDIGKKLITTAKKVAKMAGFTWEGFGSYVGVWAQVEAEKLLKVNHGNEEDSRLQIISDTAECLKVIWGQNEATCLRDMQDAVEDLFSDDRPGVWLSSVHRAKGLENDRIFIINPELLPGPWATEGTWQYEQEMNLKYVAVTRAKHELVWVSKSLEG